VRWPLEANIGEKKVRKRRIENQIVNKQKKLSFELKRLKPDKKNFFLLSLPKTFVIPRYRVVVVVVAAVVAAAVIFFCLSRFLKSVPCFLYTYENVFLRNNVLGRSWRKGKEVSLIKSRRKWKKRTWKEREREWKWEREKEGKREEKSAVFPFLTIGEGVNWCLCPLFPSLSLSFPLFRSYFISLPLPLNFFSSLFLSLSLSPVSHSYFSLSLSLPPPLFLTFSLSLSPSLFFSLYFLLSLSLQSLSASLPLPLSLSFLLSHICLRMCEELLSWTHVLDYHFTSRDSWVKVKRESLAFWTNFQPVFCLKQF